MGTRSCSDRSSRPRQGFKPLATTKKIIPEGTTPPIRPLDGEITFGLFGDGPPREVAARAGTVVTVPSKAPHNYRNAGTAPATMLVVLERSMATFFRDLGRREEPPAGPPNEDEIAAVMAACARHDITVLGGPPA